MVMAADTTMHPSPQYSETQGINKIRAEVDLKHEAETKFPLWSQEGLRKRCRTKVL